MREKASLKELRQAALPTIQYEVIRLAHEAESEQTRLQAANIVLGQEGEGVVHKVEETHIYDRLPAEQLIAVVASKIEKLAKIVPGFSIDRFLSVAKESAAVEPIQVEFSAVAVEEQPISVEPDTIQSEFPVAEEQE